MEGWIKLHRKFVEWEWYKISEMIHLFIHLLLSANSKDGKWRGIDVKRGQLLTGLHSLNENTGISIQTIRTCLRRLQETKEINMQSNNQFRIITILKYESYQDIIPTTNKRHNKQLTSDQQATNNKQEGKEGKEGINGKPQNLPIETLSFNFYAEEVKKAKEFTGQMSRDYVSMCNHICQKNKDGSFRLPFVLKIQNQLSLDDFSKLHTKAGKNIDTIISKIDTLQTNVKYHGKYTDLYLTINNWFNRDK